MLARTIFLLGVFVSPLGIAQEFGKLLTSPDERLRMDNFRSSKSQLGVDKTLTYRGTVLREGRQWVWLNDQVLPAHGDRSIHLNADQTLTLWVGNRSYILQAGQTLIPAQGLIEDPVAGPQQTLKLIR